MKLSALIAVLLVVAQGVTAMGLGPRAVCLRPDGSGEIASVLTPCCCEARNAPRAQESPARQVAGCCSDAKCTDEKPEDDRALTSHCDCVDTPIVLDALISQRADSRSVMPRSGGDAAPSLALLIAQTPRAGTPGQQWAVATGPPRAGPLLHLNTIVLRL